MASITAYATSLTRLTWIWQRYVVICDRIVSQGTFQTFGERRPAPPKDGSYAYRFVKGGKKKIDLTVFAQ